MFFQELSKQPVFSLLMVDSKVFDLWARKIAAGNIVGDGIFYQAPLYPYFIGLVYALFGPRPLAVLWVQAALGSTSCIFLARAGRRFFGSREGLLAGLLLAVYPTAIFSDSLIQKSSLDMFFVTLFLMLLAGTGAPAATVGHWFGIGLVLGCFTLTRENAIVLVGVVLIWTVTVSDRRDQRALFSRIGFFCAGIALMLLPVGFRNLAVGGEFHLTTYNAGPNFYIGNHSGADGTYQPLIQGRADVKYESSDAGDLAEQEVGRRLTPGEVSRYWLQKALRYIRDEPGHWIRLMARKVLLLLNRVEIADTYDQYSYARWSVLLRLLNPILHFGILVPLAISGMYFTRERWRSLWVVHGILVVYAGSVALFFVSSRFRLPLVPALLLFAAAGLVGLVSAVRSSRRRDLALCFILAFPAAVLSNWPLARAEVTIAQATMLTNIGNGLMNEKGQVVEAIAYFQEAIRIDPRHPSAHLCLGTALRRSGRSQEAQSHLAMAVDLQPGSPENHVQLGRVFSDLGRLGEAVIQYEIALRFEPGNAWAHYWAAGALNKMGRQPEAEWHMSEAVRLYPGFSAFR